MVARFERAPRGVLIAENDADMREILRVYLETRGLLPTALPHGRSARVAAETKSFALAVVDVRPSLPEGLALLRTLRERSAPVRTIVMTSFGDASLEARIARLGVTDILEKPFGLDDFDRMVERCR
jgi:DNA-binding NtrC family response regulator